MLVLHSDLCRAVTLFFASQEDAEKAATTTLCADCLEGRLFASPELPQRDEDAKFGGFIQALRDQATKTRNACAAPVPR